MVLVLHDPLLVLQNHEAHVLLVLRSAQVFPTITSVVVSFNGKAVVRQGLAGPSGARYQELSILKKAVEEAVPESDGISPVTYIPDLQVSVLPVDLESGARGLISCSLGLDACPSDSLPFL